MPAYHEAIVGAALAVAGMEISCAETKSRIDADAGVQGEVQGVGKDL